MAITIRTATQADIHGIAAVSMAAFDPATDIISERLFPPHLQTDDSFRQWTITRKSSRIDAQNLLMTVAVENQSDDTKNIVGFAVWFKPPTPGEVSQVPPPRPKWDFSGMDKNALEELKKVLIQDEKEIFGSEEPKDIWTLDSLGVSPNHQRRGVGKMLLNHGLDLASEQGQGCYLLATPSGLPLYLASGFKEIRNVSVFGVEYTSMMRKKVLG